MRELPNGGLVEVSTDHACEVNHIYGSVMPPTGFEALRLCGLDRWIIVLVEVVTHEPACHSRLACTQPPSHGEPVRIVVIGHRRPGSQGLRCCGDASAI